VRLIRGYEAFKETNVTRVFPFPNVWRLSNKCLFINQIKLCLGFENFTILFFRNLTAVLIKLPIIGEFPVPYKTQSQSVNRLFYFYFHYEAPSENCEKLLLASARLSVCLSVCLYVWNNSAPTGRIFMKFGIWLFLENLSRKLKYHYNVTRIKGTLHENFSTFMTISRLIPFRMRNFSEKNCRENQSTVYVQ